LAALGEEEGMREDDRRRGGKAQPVEIIATLHAAAPPPLRRRKHERERAAVNRGAGSAVSSPSSCPRLARVSTPLMRKRAWMAGPSPAMTGTRSLSARTTLLASRELAPPGERDEAAADEGGGADDEIDHRLVRIAAGDRLRGAIDQGVRRVQTEDEQNDADDGDDHADNAHSAHDLTCFPLTLRANGSLSQGVPAPR